MIALVPVGGLANRMRAISSAVSLSGGDELQIYWFKDAGLNCTFRQLFQTIPLSYVKVKETHIGHQLLFDRPRRKNLYIPRLFQQMRFDSCLYEDQTQENALDYERWKQSHHSVYLASYNQFYKSTIELKDLFVPVKSIQERIDSISEPFTAHTIGVHIRRGDHRIAIEKSPLALFVQMMERKIDEDKQTNFFVASDSETDKNLLIKRFGERIITSCQPAERNTVAGMQQAVVDIYALSKTHTILGSFYSSFSEIAAQLGHCKLQMMTL